MNSAQPHNFPMHHHPRKRYAQHFLTDPFVVSQIIATIAPQAADVIVEIGPGKGVLTEPLLARVAQLHVVEIDRDLARYLEQHYQHAAALSDKLNIHCADALKVNFALMLGERSARFVGNLPYYISTPLIFHLATFHDNIDDMHLMVQREVAARLTATVGSKSYGRLSVMAALAFEVSALFDVPPQAFAPSPKVMSTLLCFKPRREPARRLSKRAFKQIDEIVRTAFSNRRKTAAKALAALCSEATLVDLGIDPKQRADTLSTQQFLCMLKYRNTHQR